MPSSRTKLKEDLLTKTDDTPDFSFKDKIILCKVVDVYDGDTCRVVFKHGRKFVKWSVRMYGYDAPDMRLSVDCENREEKKALACKSRDFLKKKIIGDDKLVFIKCGDFDKYGRLLGEIFLEKRDVRKGNSVNKMMIDNNLGYAYFGGTKIDSNVLDINKIIELNKSE